MSVPFGKWSFAAGEISPSLFGHVDFAKFSIGASTMRNMTVNYHGGAYSRAGTMFVGFSMQTGRTVPPRLIPFQFSINQGLALEFGNFYMRVIFDGAFVTESPISITGINVGATTTIHATAHGYSNGDWAFLDGIAGTTQLNGRTFIVASAAANTFQITDVYGVAIDSSSYGAYVSGGTTARIYTLVTPYAEADLLYLKFIQSADVMTLCCWNQETGTTYAAQDLTRDEDDSWTLTPIVNATSISAPPWTSGIANVTDPGTAGNEGTAYAYVVTAVSNSDTDESVASPRVDITNSVDIAVTAGSLTINWGAVTGAGYYHIYKAPPAYAPIPGNLGRSFPVPAGALFGYAGTSYGTQFIDTNIIPDFSQVPPLHDDPFAPGQITDVEITSGGAGLTTVTWSITTSAGSGFAGYPVVVSGALTDFVIENPGENYQAGDSIAFNGAGFASGGVTYASNPSSGDTITLNGVAFTYVTTVTGLAQVPIQSTVADTMSVLVNLASGSNRPALTVASYVALPDGITIQYNTAGTAGNAYTLATTGSGTPSGSTLTGGSGITGTNPSAILVIGPETGTYPSVVSYFQERRVYGATPNNPDTYFMSQPGAFKNFDSRVPTIDTDAIIGSPWSVQVNGIQFFVSMPGGLVVLTGKQAWQLTGAGGSSLNPQPITPASQQAQPQAFNGCSSIFPPIGIDYDIIYLQAKGTRLRNLSYNFFTNIYTGQDITQISSQLFTGFEVLQGAWCEEPYKIIWVTRSDGALLSLTWDKPQEVAGWARHDTNGLFVSVCAVTEPPVDAPYLATQRFLGFGKSPYMIERMDNRIWGAAEDCWCVDCGLSLPQPTPNAILRCGAPEGAGSIIAITMVEGGKNYSPLTAAAIVDDNGGGVGIGAILTPIIHAGVITDVTVDNGGALYTFPAVVFSDPGGGFGAQGTAILNTAAIFLADSAVFGSGSVGSVIRMGGGIAKITVRTSAQQVTAEILSPITDLIPNSGGMVAPQPAGSWTLTGPVSSISGLDYLIGATVTGLADGNVITPRVVDATGSIGLDAPASAVIVGLGFRAQLQSVYLETGNPTVQGQRKKISAVTARIESSRGLLMGSNQPDGSTLSPPQLAPIWNGLSEVPDEAQMPYNGTFQPLYTGDVRIPVSGGFAKPGQVCLQQDNPLPMQILALVPEILPGDTPQVSAPPRQQQRAR